MSEGGDAESMWAHVLWQRHGLRMEEFLGMSREARLVYIASEQLEMKEPAGTLNVLLKSLSKIKPRKHR